MKFYAGLFLSMSGSLALIAFCLTTTDPIPVFVSFLTAMMGLWIIHLRDKELIEYKEQEIMLRTLTDGYDRHYGDPCPVDCPRGRAYSGDCPGCI